MDLQHVNIKIALEGELQIDSDRIIEVFHQWIQEQVMDELLVDVADYRHVPAGPGILIMGLEGDYNLDQTGGRYGLRYNRKKPVDGTNTERFSQALGAATKACQLLEKEFEGKLAFDRKGLELFINDRALAPNTPETFEASKKDLEEWVKSLGGGKIERTHADDPRKLFGVTLALEKPLNI